MLQGGDKAQMKGKYLSERYAEVYRHRGYAICTLKVAIPSEGDELGYVIDDARFAGTTFELLEEAIAAIDRECQQH